MTRTNVITLSEQKIDRSCRAGEERLGGSGGRSL